MTELINEIFLDDRIQHEANSKALLLAQTRFRTQVFPFVKNKPERLTYAQTEIDRIIIECATEVDADVDYVSKRFKQYVAEAVAVSEPQKQQLEFTPAELKEGLPPSKNDPDQKDPEPQATTEVTDSGAVLEDEITEPDATIDLNSDTVKASCFRCGNALTSKVSSVCPSCTAELAEKVGLSPVPNQQYMVPADPNARMECTYCQAKGMHYEGTPDEINKHITANHQNELMQQRMQPPQNLQPMAFKVAEIAEEESPTTTDQNGSNPSHHFDDVIQEMADRAAAQQFSKIDDDEIQQIASRYGLDPAQVRESVLVTATFGNFTAANGDLSDKELPDGYTEVEMEGMGGTVESHDAQVPVQLAVDKVAQDLQMKPDLVYSELKDSYGADLGDQYHASVSGEHRFYLPSNMIQVHSHRTLREIIEQDRRSK